MHHEAWQWITKFATDEPISILDIGGRDVNTSAQHLSMYDLFPKADYTVLDLRSGSNVDIVADAATWQPNKQYDLVLCTEVFEHTPDWPAICEMAYWALQPKGSFAITCAAPGRKPHSGIENTKIILGEWYENINPLKLYQVLYDCGFEQVIMSVPKGNHVYDVRAHAVRP